MNLLVIFAKAPIKGEVKTRLKKGTGLTDDDLLRLYKAFLADTAKHAIRTCADKISLHYYPQSGMGRIEELLTDFFSTEDMDRFQLSPQEGGSFDLRFANTARRMGEEGGNVVVVGSDLPHLQPGMVDGAFEFLSRKTGLVLGPSNEGGVYLIGFNTALDFTGVFEGSGVELENLARLAEKHDLAFKLLEEVSDIDVAADLASFICRIEAMEYGGRQSLYMVPKHTIKAIRELGLTVAETGAGERGRRFVKKC
ncbi:2-phospho-L-lactate guanylyltransferase [archaeon BMS3Abin16]|nr:2-phospho-L-lactate guanylyltransferase [archaeon BMS3Abin16]